MVRSTTADRERGPIGEVRRKYLINKARRIAERYGLQDELDGWVYAADREAITGLTVVELDSLVTWLVQTSENIETICDRWDVPPAR